MFAEFDLEPLGSASIAQVHKAKLLDGRGSRESTKARYSRKVVGRHYI